MVERRTSAIELAFDPATLTGKVVHKSSGTAWTIDLAGARGVACGAPDPMRAEFPWSQHSRALERLRPLRPGDLRRTRELPDGVELDFRVAGADFRVSLRLGPEPEELVFSLQPLPTATGDLIAAELPGPLRPADNRPIQVLTAYRHQGRLFTGQPGPMEPETPGSRELNMSEGRYRMRFFGVLGDTDAIGSAKAGFLAIIEENSDARIIIRQAEDGQLSCSVAWVPSMGTLAYTRTIRYRFQSRPTVTTLAKAFRAYARSAGLFKSLAEKMAERPMLRSLVGATACFIGYEASPLDYLGTLRRLRQMGHRRFYVFPLFHINMGSQETFSGLKLIDIRAQADAFRELGAIVGSWVWLSGTPDRPELARLAARNADGTPPLNWQIGDDRWLQTCMGQAHQHLAGSGDALLAADMHHFDTTASNSLMECYAPAHPLDRRGDRAARIRQFQEALSRGRLVASEGVKDWAVPYYDMGSNKEIPVRDESPAFRVVPLQHLVYHDALLFLWWEVHNYDCPYFGIGGDPVHQSLTDLLYGDMPLLFPVGRQYRWAGKTKEAGAIEFDQSLDIPLCRQAAERAAEVARHFERVATEDMTDFAWLTGDGTVQQTQFANGASVIANFGAAPFRAANGAVVPPLAAISL